MCKEVICQLSFFLDKGNLKFVTSEPLRFSTVIICFLLPVTCYFQCTQDFEVIPASISRNKTSHFCSTPFLQNRLNLGHQLLFVWHIQNIPGGKDVVLQPVQSVFRWNTLLVCAKDDANGQVFIWIADLGG